MTDDPGGDIAHQDAGQGGFPAPAHDDQVGADLLGCRHDGGMRHLALGHHGLEGHPQFVGCGLDDRHILLHPFSQGSPQIRSHRLEFRDDLQHLDGDNLAVAGPGQFQGHRHRVLPLVRGVGADHQFAPSGGADQRRKNILHVGHRFLKVL